MIVTWVETSDERGADTTKARTHKPPHSTAPDESTHDTRRYERHRSHIRAMHRARQSKGKGARAGYRKASERPPRFVMQQRGTQPRTSAVMDPFDPALSVVSLSLSEKRRAATGAA